VEYSDQAHLFELQATVPDRGSVAADALPPELLVQSHEEHWLSGVDIKIFQNLQAHELVLGCESQLDIDP
jgi:hypothetical protein